MSTDDPQQPQTPAPAPAPPGPPETPAAPAAPEAPAAPGPAPAPGPGQPPTPPGPPASQFSTPGGESPKKKKPIGLIIGLVGGAVALLAVVAVVLVIVLAGGGGSPDESVRTYMNATIDGDCEELVRHPVSEYSDVEECEDDIKESEESRKDAGVEDFALTIDTAEVTEEADEEATVEVEAKIDYVQDGEDETDEFEVTFKVVKNDDGDWVVEDESSE